MRHCSLFLNNFHLDISYDNILPGHFTREAIGSSEGGGVARHTPLPDNFFQYHAVLGKNGWCPPPPPAFGLRPTSLKSWIRHWKQSLYHEITVVLPQDEQK